MADDHPSDDLASREPTVEDLRDLCRELNLRSARYVVIGGFAIRAASYIRSTMDVDLLVAADAENEARVFAALSTLSDHAARELQPGELLEHTVIRVADEIVVDLMRSAGGIDYAEAARDVVVHDVDGVAIPFASPRLLWRMKVVTHREKMRRICCFSANGLPSVARRRRLCREAAGRRAARCSPRRPRRPRGICVDSHADAQ